jgi:radical SAM superfamily enzyme YgiQ (UPF0313 family)
MKGNQDEIDIWLCDLTYTQQSFASEIMPNAIGCIATYANKVLGNNIRFKLFKQPEIFAEWLLKKPTPRLIGFSNYAWNSNLTLKIAQTIKSKHPEILMVLGGPNYPLNVEEREDFVRKHDYIDYFVIKEGELAFTNLLKKLIHFDFKAGHISESNPSVDFLNNQGNFIPSLELETRIKNLEEIPSPYVAGLLDEFFDGNLLPIIETARGCPFECTFCVEGGGYYTRVNKSKQNRINEEIEYIAKKVSQSENPEGRSDLHIADSNFGMYKEDEETCNFIGVMQKKYGFPKIVSASTGKNKPERVLAAAKLTNGALRLSGSVQSLDPEVLVNIKRGNISSEKLIQLSLSAQELGANTYSEIIMGLPGSSKEEHFESIRKIMNAEFDALSMYQLMLLPGTDLSTQETRKQYKFKTAFRVVPRCFGSYKFFDEIINIAEIEEIVIGNDSMTFEEYLDSRKMHLVVTLFYNDGIYKNIFPLLKHLGIKIFDWIKKIYNFRHSEFNQLVDDFIAETKYELWDDRKALEELTRNEENIKEFISGDRGSNLIFKYKIKAISQHYQSLHEISLSTLKSLLEENGKEQYLEILEEILRYSTKKMENLFLENAIIKDSFLYDIESFLKEEDFDSFESYKTHGSINIQFFHTAEQQKMIQQYRNVFGNNISGIARIAAKQLLGRFMRKTKITNKCAT